MGLPKDNRLRKPAEFRYVLSAGRKSGDRLLLVAAVPNNRSEDRVGLSVSKRTGGAVVRNRVKRRLREIFRELGASERSENGPSFDIVATARPAAAEATFTELRESASRLISKVESGR